MGCVRRTLFPNAYSCRAGPIFEVLVVSGSFGQALLDQQRPDIDTGYAAYGRTLVRGPAVDRIKRCRFRQTVTSPAATGPFAAAGRGADLVDCRQIDAMQTERLEIERNRVDAPDMSFRSQKRGAPQNQDSNERHNAKTHTKICPRPRADRRGQ